jgi:hypothetical protein
MNSTKFNFNSFEIMKAFSIRLLRLQITTGAGLKCGVGEDRDQRFFCGNWILEVERKRSWRCERLVDGRVIEFLMKT